MRMSLVAAIALLSVALAACSASGALPSAAAPNEPAAPASAEPSMPPSSAAPAASSGGGGRGDADYDYGTGGEASSSPAPADGPVEVATAGGPPGTWLTGSGGLTLYTFDPDSANTSTCVDDCAQAWPPFTVASADSLEPGGGVNAS